MINWPSLKLPPINLWNAPRRGLSEEQEIRYLKIAVDYEKRQTIELERKIKDREFLYYCHSGRFPE